VENAYDYLSRYTHRVAISNHRLTSLGAQTVSFRARDNQHPGQHRLITIPAAEFIRRFLLHVLPHRFVKIRHFGLMASCNAKTKLETARTLIVQQGPAAKPAQTDSSKQLPTWRDLLLSLTGTDRSICPQCGRGTLLRFNLTEIHQILSPTTWDSS
jgi:hypothetical protein